MDSDDIDPQVQPCETVGFVVANDDDFICLVQTHGFDGQYYNHLCIPKGMVQKTKKLK
jgi:hypothetical protein